jgi:uncharacterized protein (UPF0335 family)
MLVRKERIKMNFLKTEKIVEHDDYPLNQFNEAIDRLQEEHVLLESDLFEIYGMTKGIDHRNNPAHWKETIMDLKPKMVTFKQELQAHSEWEEAELFIMINKYFEEVPGMYALIEKEHELAIQSIDAAIAAINKLAGSVNQIGETKIGTYLLLAHHCLAAHFKNEEHIISSLVDNANQYKIDCD